MDGMRFVGGFALGVTMATVDLVVAAYDLITRRDPDAELKRFIAEHREVTWHYVSPEGE